MRFPLKPPSPGALKISPYAQRSIPRPAFPMPRRWGWWSSTAQTAASPGGDSHEAQPGLSFLGFWGSRDGGWYLFWSTFLVSPHSVFVFPLTWHPPCVARLVLSSWALRWSVVNIPKGTWPCGSQAMAMTCPPPLAHCSGSCGSQKSPRASAPQSSQFQLCVPLLTCLS